MNITKEELLAEQERTVDSTTLDKMVQEAKEIVAACLRKSGVNSLCILYTCLYTGFILFRTSTWIAVHLQL